MREAGVGGGGRERRGEGIYRGERDGGAGEDRGKGERGVRE